MGGSTLIGSGGLQTPASGNGVAGTGYGSGGSGGSQTGSAAAFAGGAGTAGYVIVTEFI
jgi:hypothetical protein